MLLFTPGCYLASSQINIMKAIQLNEYGPATNLKPVTVDKPAFAANQVLIKIKASAVNPVDVKVRAGTMARVMPKTLPTILGSEAAGMVEETGSDVKRLKKGDEVYTMPNFFSGGTYAEYVSVNENEVALKPASLSFVQAAAVPVGAGTAYTAIIKTANMQPGQKILIHGAAGAVGSFAVQIAKIKGAYVIGTASGAGINIIKSIGADEVIDYTKTNFSTAVKDMDVVLDLVGGETLMKSFTVIKKGGLLISTVMPPPADKAAAAGIKAQMIQTQPDAVMLTEIATWIDEGKIKTQAPIVLKLDQAQQAHEMIENKTAKGKLVFEM
ncbi:MAG: NADP-dependent oxidoreductase, partial [Bacteroidota bacterium]